MKPTVISQDTTWRDSFAAAPRLWRNLADGGHCDAVCRHAGRAGGGGVVQCLAAGLISARTAVPAAELGGRIWDVRCRFWC